jgi:hypothetical protein
MQWRLILGFRGSEEGTGGLRSGPLPRSGMWSQIEKAPDRTTGGPYPACAGPVFRYESVIGEGIRAKGPAGQVREAVLACEILNRMIDLGRPASYRIGR